MMMKKIFSKTSLFLLAIILFSCSNDDSEPMQGDTGGDTGGDQDTEVDGRYIIMSSEVAIVGDVAYLSVYDSLPTANIENAIEGTTQVNAFGRFNTYKNKWAFKKKKFTGETGIVRYSMNAEGSLDLDGFISTSKTVNYAILDDTHGYYYDSGDGEKTISTFNPTTMARTGDFTIPNEIFGDELKNYEIAVASKSMIISKEKLFVNVAYTVIEEDGVKPEGVYIPKFTMLIINTATNEVEKKIRHEGPVYDQGHGTRTEFSAYVITKNGDIYMSTHALFTSRYTINPNLEAPTSCVFKLEFNNLDFDHDWVVKGKDIQGVTDDGNYVVWSLAIDKDENLYTDCSRVAVLEDYSNLISNIHYPYIIDKETMAATPINAPATNFGHADGNLYAVQGEVYYQYKDAEKAVGSYYLLKPDASFTEVFGITDTYPRALGYLEIQ